MSRTFSSLHARAFSHATEDLDKVKTAVLNAIGDAELKVSRAEGHHGNQIDIVEADVKEESVVVGFFGRLSREDLGELKQTMATRIDDACNIFMKIDKQSAYQGTVRLGTGDDVISIRIKTRAYPAKPDLALRIATEFLSDMMQADEQSHPPRDIDSLL